MNVNNSAMSILAETATANSASATPHSQNQEYTEDMRIHDEYTQSHICPILQDFPETPCRFNEHIFDYTAIQAWIKKFADEGKDYILDPITREKLRSFSNPITFTESERNSLRSNIILYESHAQLRKRYQDSINVGASLPISSTVPVIQPNITLPDSYWQRIEATTGLSNIAVNRLPDGFWNPTDVQNNVNDENEVESNESDDDISLLNYAPLRRRDQESSYPVTNLSENLRNESSQHQNTQSESLLRGSSQQSNTQGNSRLRSSNSLQPNFLSSFVQTNEQRKVLVFILERAKVDWGSTIGPGKRLAWFRDQITNELYDEVSGPLNGYTRLSTRNIYDKFSKAEQLARLTYSGQGQHSNDPNGDNGEDIPTWKKLFYEFFRFLTSHPSTNSRTNASRQAHRSIVRNLIGIQTPLGTNESNPRSEIMTENPPEITIDRRTVGHETNNSPEVIDHPRRQSDSEPPRTRRRVNSYEQNALNTLQTFGQMSSAVSTLDRAFNNLSDSISNTRFSHRNAFEIVQSIEMYEEKLILAQEQDNDVLIRRYKRFISVFNSELAVLENHFDSNSNEVSPEQLR